MLSTSCVFSFGTLHAVDRIRRHCARIGVIDYPGGREQSLFVARRFSIMADMLPCILCNAVICARVHCAGGPPNLATTDEGGRWQIIKLQEEMKKMKGKKHCAECST